MEAEFAFNQERTARFRNVLGGLFASLLVVVSLSNSIAAWKSGVFMHDSRIFASYLTFLVSCVFFCLAYAISYKIPIIQKHLEYTSYFIATSATVTQSILAVWWKHELYSERNFLKFAPALSELFGLEFDPLNPGEREDSVIFHIVVIYNELLMGIFLQSTLLVIFVLFDVLTPTRFFIACRLQMVNTLVGIIPFIYGAYQLPETVLPK